MKVLLSILLLSLCFSKTLEAEAINVRSADHSDFTRIAIDLNKPEEAKVQKIDDSIVIQFPKSMRSISTDAFFRRISRERILSITPNLRAKQLTMNLACDCSFTTFVAEAKTLVIDVTKVDSDVSGSSTLYATPNWPPTTRKVELTLALSSSTEKGTKKTDHSGEVMPEKAQTMPPLQIGVSQQSNAATMRLHSTLARALAQDQQKSVGSNTSVEQERNRDQILFRSHALLEKDEGGDTETADLLNVSDCRSALELDPSSWGEYEDAKSHLSEARMSSVEGLEKFSSRAARKLAKVYLSLAMGAEARAILAGISDKTTIDQKLMSLAELTDGNASQLQDHWFHDIKGCSDMLIWQLLDFESSKERTSNLLTLTDAQLTAVRQQFEIWPSALKGVFGPRLASALSQLNARETALFTLRKSNGAPGLTTGEREVVTARVERNDVDLSVLKNALNPIVELDEDAAPTAVISLAEIAVEQDEELGFAQKEALKSYQDELKGTELEPELLRARIITAIHAEHFAEATSLIDEYTEIERTTKVHLVLDKLGNAILEIEADAEFLKEAVSLPVSHYNNIADVLQQRIKARMAELGFSDLANQLGRTLSRGDAQNKSSEKLKTVAMNDTSATDEDEVLVRKGRDTLLNDEANVTTTVAQENEAAQKTTATLNQTPLAAAIAETQTVLDSLAALKEDLQLLGL